MAEPGEKSKVLIVWNLHDLNKYIIKILLAKEVEFMNELEILV